MKEPVNTPVEPPLQKFSAYQRLIVGVLAFLQFAVILDFMLISPLGAVIMPDLSITPRQFGLVVSAYAFSAAASSVLTAGFADRFDRKKLLLFFYTGFILGTLWCGVAMSFESLLLARIVTGLFGGVIGSVVLAIATDLFAPELRGRVMGLIQTAFSASQVMGIPIALYLSNHWNWHAPFLGLVTMGVIGGIVLVTQMRPITDHLKAPQERSAWQHLYHVVSTPTYLLAFASTALLTTGGFMLMPFSSAFIVRNLGIPLQSLPTVYLVTGLCTIFAGPLIGRAADAWGKFRVFTGGTALSIVMVLVFTHLGPISLPVLVLVNATMFVGIFSRVIPFQALMSSVPTVTQRGAFNAINSATQQLSGGVASVLAGHIVAFDASGALRNVDVIGDVVVGTTLATWAMLFYFQRYRAGARSASGNT